MADVKESEWGSWETFLVGSKSPHGITDLSIPGSAVRRPFALFAGKANIRNK